MHHRAWKPAPGRLLHQTRAEKERPELHRSTEFESTEIGECSEPTSHVELHKHRDPLVPQSVVGLLWAATGTEGQGEGELCPLLMNTAGSRDRVEACWGKAQQ